MKAFAILSIVGMVLLSCGGDQSQLDSKALKKEMSDREIKKISESEILNLAKERGDKIATQAQMALGSKLKEALQEGGPVHALEFCNVNAYPLLDDLRETYNVSIKRASLRTRNPDDKPNDIEAQILDAYQYNIENELELNDNLQKLGDSAILFTRPISLNNGICLNCHGEVGTEINQLTLEKIEELYPEDNAKGHKLGDLRGMWSIVFDRKELVLDL